MNTGEKTKQAISHKKEEIMAYAPFYRHPKEGYASATAPSRSARLPLPPHEEEERWQQEEYEDTILLQPRASYYGTPAPGSFLQHMGGTRHSALPSFRGFVNYDQSHRHSNGTASIGRPFSSSSNYSSTPAGAILYSSSSSSPVGATTHSLSSRRAAPHVQLATAGEGQDLKQQLQREEEEGEDENENDGGGNNECCTAAEGERKGLEKRRGMADPRSFSSTSVIPSPFYHRRRPDSPITRRGVGDRTGLYFYEDRRGVPGPFLLPPPRPIYSSSDNGYAVDCSYPSPPLCYTDDSPPVVLHSNFSTLTPKTVMLNHIGSSDDAHEYHHLQPRSRRFPRSLELDSNPLGVMNTATAEEAARKTDANNKSRLCQRETPEDENVTSSTATATSRIPNHATDKEINYHNPKAELNSGEQQEVEPSLDKMENFSREEKSSGENAPSGDKITPIVTTSVPTTSSINTAATTNNNSNMLDLLASVASMAGSEEKDNKIYCDTKLNTANGIDRIISEDDAAEGTTHPEKERSALSGNRTKTPSPTSAMDKLLKTVTPSYSFKAIVQTHANVPDDKEDYVLRTERNQDPAATTSATSEDPANTQDTGARPLKTLSLDQEKANGNLHHPLSCMSDDQDSQREMKHVHFSKRNGHHPTPKRVVNDDYALPQSLYEDEPIYSQRYIYPQHTTERPVLYPPFPHRLWKENRDFYYPHFPPPYHEIVEYPYYRLPPHGMPRSHAQRKTPIHYSPSRYYERDEDYLFNGRTIDEYTSQNAVDSNVLTFLPSNKPSSKQGKVILRRKCAWKNYPELEQFLIDNRDEYLKHSALNYTQEQKQYNNELTERLLEVAKKHNYEFDPKDFNFVAIRDRIRCYYKSYVQNCKKRGIAVSYKSSKKSKASDDISFTDNEKLPSQEDDKDGPEEGYSILKKIVTDDTENDEEFNHDKAKVSKTSEVET